MIFGQRGDPKFLSDPRRTIDSRTSKPENFRPILIAQCSFDHGVQTMADNGGSKHDRNTSEATTNSGKKFVIFTTDKIALRSSSGKFLCAENGGGGAVVANRDKVGPWETLKIVISGGNFISLKTANNKFICAENCGGGAVVANRDQIGRWETFKFKVVSPAHISLETLDNFFFCADQGRQGAVVADRRERKTWEVFEVVLLGGLKRQNSSATLGASHQ